MLILVIYSVRVQEDHHGITVWYPMIFIMHYYLNWLDYDDKSSSDVTFMRIIQFTYLCLNQ